MRQNNMSFPLMSPKLRAFENRLSLAPLELQTGDRVLESGAGTGIWASEFAQQNKEEGIMLNIECIDISDRQFPSTHPSNVNFSVHSVVDLPAEWTGTFSYAHQRLLIGAMNDSRWRQAVGELFRVLSPGGWVELVEPDASGYHFDTGPWSKKLKSMCLAMCAETGIIDNLGTFLLPILAEVGFVDVRREVRLVPIGRSGENGYRSEEWRDMWGGMKQPWLSADGYGIAKTEEEIEELLQGSAQEWNNSTDAGTTFCTILARKP
ncbi:hypothetical protein GYMLUDRAFT_753485 [Collybiopsis luxurians FD-317 M1]|uniref:Methyltransferase domain-containing protein n=1 Tax=Collybiopsis luxurians FD-317 M1 TaxID=944289 RepID=A0A0D0BQX4_9AGAR|nr:hypothetical protein GYMLUDRAFT_753485 [Collybiopsis luxurians FD-317 M1]